MNGDEFALKVGKGAAYIFGGTFVGYVISFFYKILLARWLGPSDFGIISLVLMVVGIFSLLSLGIPTATTKYIAEKTSHAPRIVRTSLISILVVSLAASVMLFALAPFISDVIFKTNDPTIVRITSVILFFNILNFFVSAISSGFQKMGEYSIGGIIDKVLKVFATGVLLYLGMGLIGAVAAIGIGIIASVIYLAFSNRKSLIVGRFDKKYFKKILIFGIPLFLGSLGTTILSWTDTIFLGIFTNSTIVGFYNAAFPIFWYLSIPISALAISILPAFSEIHAKKNYRLLTSMVNRSLKYTFYLLIPASVGVILLSKYVVLLLYGASFLESVKVLEILATGAFFNAVSLIFIMYLSGIGKSSSIMKSVLAAAGFNVAVSWILIKNFGLNGAGVSTVASTFLMACILYNYVRKVERIEIRPVLKSIASTIVMGLVVLLVLTMDMRGMYKMIISVILGMATYTASMMAVGAFDAFDKKVAKRVTDKIKRIMP